jgi:hypothetical protein
VINILLIAPNPTVSSGTIESAHHRPMSHRSKMARYALPAIIIFLSAAPARLCWSPSR